LQAFIKLDTDCISINNEKMKLHLITPCTRPENLYKISNSIPLDEDIHWWIIFDSDKPLNFELYYPPETHIYYLKSDPAFGGPQRNLALDKIQDGFCNFLDDDTILHNGLIKAYESMSENQILIGQQILRDDTLRLNAEVPQSGKIDSGNVIFDRTLVGDLRYENLYESDGIFFNNLAKKHPDKIFFANYTISIYNALRY
jgi:hypothetical protein